MNLQNRFDKLIVTKVNQIEIHEPQDATATNHHKRGEIANTKSKLGAKKNSSQSIRPSNAITANENNTASKFDKNCSWQLKKHFLKKLFLKKHLSWAIIIYAELKIYIYLIIQ